MMVRARLSVVSALMSKAKMSPRASYKEMYSFESLVRASGGKPSRRRHCAVQAGGGPGEAETRLAEIFRAFSSVDDNG